MIIGAEFDVAVNVIIQPGWHLSANPPGVPEMKPTSLAIGPGSEKRATLVKVEYPPGEAKVLGSLGTEKVKLYEGKVSIPAILKLADDVRPGTLVVSLELSYQACNDRLCQAPMKLVLPLSVTVVGE